MIHNKWALIKETFLTDDKDGKLFDFKQNCYQKLSDNLQNNFPIKFVSR